MLGAIVGDIVGSVHQRRRNAVKTLDFLLFSDYSHWTDDTVLTVAVAETLLTSHPYEETLRELALKRPDAGFGGMFARWFRTRGSKPYNNLANGSAMRVSPVGWAFDTLEETLAEAQRAKYPLIVCTPRVLGLHRTAQLIDIFWEYRNIPR